MCDDGNANSGDGCSDICIVEKDYTCKGGYPNTKDRCSYVQTEIIGVQVNTHNDIIVKFSRPIKIVPQKLANRDLLISYRDS